MYMVAASEDVSTEIDLIAWWKRHAIELPKWANAFNKVLLVQPSSAAAERVFHFYKWERESKIGETESKMG